MTQKNKLKLVITRPFPPEAPERFRDFEGVSVYYGDDLTDADIVFGQPDIKTLASCKNLKWLQISSAGADSYAKHPELFQGIRLTTVSGAFGQSIAEWTLALTLALYKHLHLFRDNQNALVWRDEGRQFSPENRRVLVLGCGDLGSSVAELFKRFHCRTTGIRRNASLPKPAAFDEVYPLSALDEQLPKADILVGTLPQTQETMRLLDACRLSLLNPDAILLNLGRGSLIDLDALAERLQSGHLFGAALDVTSPEPLPKDHPLWKTPNCILTPHASGGSFGHLKATEEKICEICRENLKRYLSGDPLLNEIDFATGYRSAENRY